MTMSVNSNDAARELAAALESGEGIEASLGHAMDQIADKIRADFEQLADERDSQALASRGYRQLTSDEVKFYEAMTAALRSNAPQQTFADFLGADVMPVTIIESVIGEIEQDHPLLESIDFQYVGYCTKWPRSKTGIKKAAWGKITAAVSQEITGSIDVLSITQNKLSAYAIVPLDILDMGPAWVDGYVRAILKESIYEGLEDAIINGTGHDEPVGMIRDVHVGVTVNSETGYPAKTAVALTSLKELEFNAVIASMAKTEFGKTRKFDKVYAAMNMATFLTKWAPAVPASYVGGPREMPFPCEVIISNAVAANKAVLYVPKRYQFCVGGSRNGNIDFSDHAGFLDDVRTFKVIQHGDGIAEDNTAAVYCDVSGLRPYIPQFVGVKNTDALLLAYSVTISDVKYDAVIDQAAKTATIDVPYGSTINSLAGTFVLSDDATAKIGSTAQVSGTTTNNWTSGIAKDFVVTSEDGAATATYKITINVAAQA